ncbi:hypothetical protein M406DRAFT_281190 [Cryphonectria parasitica EP155]|uniref:Holocytochrome c-type synthase n=1 Tax=Cryphonectria parasitica (strain ATCC 38755 / EP155) TaxID=660469 RepID=A0A9P5CJH5_CRYP1|nr:uncharacterized protein M406DRAFT_281190 [Cryphonectria parasitica EP155]KAF3761269.1 hypothetical protein M406DRAFT_281190 [Cryphonectria parasitica EP155]
MGFFWADPVPTSSTSSSKPSACPVPHQKRGDAPPPPSCPMHKSTQDALSSASNHPPAAAAAPSSCPVPHDQRNTSSTSEDSSFLSKLNPLNYMFSDLSQSRAPNQTHVLPTERDPSSIPKGSGDGNWEYPSPQQMYNAMLRKGYTDTDVTAVESMVQVHNFLNEGCWAEIVDWEKRFGGGFSRAWQICRRGEENAQETQRLLDWRNNTTPIEPTLVRFQGRPKDLTPKAFMLQVMGWIYPAKFGTEKPFDRHDWYVSRNVDGTQKEVRYVIDYYSGPPEPTGEPVFYLDVRPAMTPTGAVERLMRWGGDVWWRASGGAVREANQATGK